MSVEVYNSVVIKKNLFKIISGWQKNGNKPVRKKFYIMEMFNKRINYRIYILMCTIVLKNVVPVYESVHAIRSS